MTGMDELLAELERELAEVTTQIKKAAERKVALEQRRAEILAGIDGIKQTMKGRM